MIKIAKKLIAAVGQFARWLFVDEQALRTESVTWIESSDPPLAWKTVLLWQGDGFCFGVYDGKVYRHGSGCECSPTHWAKLEGPTILKGPMYG